VLLRLALGLLLMTLLASCVQRSTPLRSRNAVKRPASPAGTWRMIGGDCGNCNRSTVPVLPLTKVVWHARIIDAREPLSIFPTGPVVAQDGTVFACLGQLGSIEKTLVALEAKSGSVSWIARKEWSGSPALWADGTLAVTDSGVDQIGLMLKGVKNPQDVTQLRHLDQNGKPLGDVVLCNQGHGISEPSFDPQGNCWVWSGDRLYRIDSKGVVVTSASFPGFNCDRPAFDPQGRAYVTYSGSVACVDATGKTVWSTPLGRELRDGPCYAETGRVYAISVQPYQQPEPRTLHCLSGKGVELWQAALGSGSAGLAVAADGTAIVVLQAGLRAVTPEGAVGWEVGLSDSGRNPVLTGDGAVLIALSDGSLSCRDLATGGELSRIQLSSSTTLFATPAIRDDGSVILLDYDGNCYALD
jgi:outer membrane protein assembly factor BamB